MQPTAIQKPRRDRIAAQCTLASSPKRIAGMAIGMVRMAAAIARNTAMNGTPKTQCRRAGRTALSLLPGVRASITTNPSDRSKAVNSK